MDNYSDIEHINVGTGEDGSIAGLAERIRDLVCPQANISFDTSKPDGMPRKVLDISKIKNLGWEPQISLTEGLAATYTWYLNALEEGEARL